MKAAALNHVELNKA